MRVDDWVFFAGRPPERRPDISRRPARSAHFGAPTAIRTSARQPFGADLGRAGSGADHDLDDDLQQHHHAAGDLLGGQPDHQRRRFDQAALGRRGDDRQQQFGDQQRRHPVPESEQRHRRPGARAATRAGSTNTGSIEVDDTSTTTTDSNGIAHGPFASGTDRYGIRVIGPGDFTGDILNSSAATLTVKGDNSYGISVETKLVGNLNNGGALSVTGNNSFGIRTTGHGQRQCDPSAVRRRGQGAAGREPGRRHRRRPGDQRRDLHRRATATRPAAPIRIS